MSLNIKGEEITNIRNIIPIIKGTINIVFYIKYL